MTGQCALHSFHGHMGFTFELAGGVAAASMSLYLISFHGEFYMVKSIWWIPQDSTVFTLEQEVSPTCSFFLRESVEFTTGFTFEQALSQPTSGFFLWVSVVNSMGFKVAFSYEYPWDSPLSKRRQLFLMSFLGFPRKLRRLLTRTALNNPPIC